MANIFFNKGKAGLLSGSIHLGSDTIKCALVPSAVTDPDLDFRSQITECSGSGYTTGGVALSGKVVSESDANNKAVFDCDDISFPSLNVGAVAGVVIYQSNGSAATDVLIAYIDAALTSSGTDVTFPINANGLFTL